MHASWIDRIAGWLLGLVALAAGLVFTVSLAVAALFVGVVAIVAGLLRGGRPPLFAGRAAVRRAGAGEVVDIEAREVGDSARALDRPAAPVRHDD
ncbi:MAG TPA: hypothetical protein VLU41_04835 [Ideonella sp.]|nr:hypothetical protein [Ideonella sp.]